VAWGKRIGLRPQWRQVTRIKGFLVESAISEPGLRTPPLSIAAAWGWPRSKIARVGGWRDVGNHRLQSVTSNTTKIEKTEFPSHAAGKRPQATACRGESTHQAGVWCGDGKVSKRTKPEREEKLFIFRGFFRFSAPVASQAARLGRQLCMQHPNKHAKRGESAAARRETPPICFYTDSFPPQLPPRRDPQPLLWWGGRSRHPAHMIRGPLCCPGPGRGERRAGSKK
jgi:hypothetical protein